MRSFYEHLQTHLKPVVSAEDTKPVLHVIKGGVAEPAAPELAQPQAIEKVQKHLGETGVEAADK